MTGSILYRSPAHDWVAECLAEHLAHLLTDDVADVVVAGEIPDELSCLAEVLADFGVFLGLIVPVDDRALVGAILLLDDSETLVISFDHRKNAPPNIGDA